MRPSFQKAAFAALLLTSSIGMSAAFAASGPGADTGGKSDGRTTPEAYQTDMMPAVQNYAPAPARTASHAMRAEAHSMRPRLSAIDSELNRLDRRISVNTKRGYMSHREAREARNEAHQIKQQAWRTAQRHNGAIPKVAFMKLQHEVRDLGRTVHRMATDGIG